MQYLLLFAAIVLEITGTTFLEYSYGFTKLVPSAMSVITYMLCFVCFARALLKIDLGVAYATWCSVGIVASSIIAAVLFDQKLTPAGIVGIVLIITGCVILNVFGSVR